jgi:hypothetical protein
VDIVPERAIVEHLFDRHVVTIRGKDGIDARHRVGRDPPCLEHVDVSARVGHDAVRGLPEMSPDPELVRLRE